VFAFEAWVPRKLVKKLEKWIKNVFVGDVEDGAYLIEVRT
jgi:hypothetical protein